jgi:hypothetical protein
MVGGVRKARVVSGGCFSASTPSRQLLLGFGILRRPTS